jgi:excisionase family DNA binding protein
VTVTPIPDLLLVSEAAQVARVSTSTITREIADGRLAATRIRSCLRIRSDELARWLDERTAQ